ncbi:MAG: hypothetical protein AAF490_23610, partial [Chloroflexota bacterium]
TKNIEKSQPLMLVTKTDVSMNEASETEDGFEMTWQVNHLALFLLSPRLLLTLLQRANAWVINISSSEY